MDVPTSLYACAMKILLMTAHPDDADIMAGGAIARWTDEGHDVHSVILTRGDKGHEDPAMTPERVGILREAEQRAAAEVLGVRRLRLLDFTDGELAWVGPQLAATATRLIREERPDMVVTHDPYAGAPGYRVPQLHPDHRAAGAAAVEACYFYAPGPLYYPEHLRDGLAPHRVREILLVMSDHVDHRIDITGTFDRKVSAVSKHASQFGAHPDLRSFLRAMAERAGAPAGLALAEGFKRLTL
jgi:LmbE family N-acetylglucosaminyl deacetylase